MCGLFGIITDSWNKAKGQALWELALINQTRGMDGTGFMTIATNEKKNSVPQAKITKSVDDATAFLSSDLWPSVVSQANRKVHAVCGHVRAATVGKINARNAHPFRFGNITMMHNGTVDAFKFDQNDKLTSDSMVLGHKMAEEGLYPALKAARWGAYAVVVWDNEKKKLHFIRNDKRPLAFAESKNSNTIFYSSEVRHLKFALSACINQFNITILDKHDHFTIDPVSFEQELEDVGDHVDPKVEYKRTVWPATDTYMNTYTQEMNNPFRRGHQQQLSLPKSSKDFGAKVSGPLPYRFEKDQLHVEGYLGYGGKFMTKLHAERVLNEGCANCTKQATTDEVVHWADDDVYICESCLEIPGVSRYALEKGGPVCNVFTEDELNS